MSDEIEQRMHHWIYVLGGADLQTRARRWAERKAGQGKIFTVIAAGLEEVGAEDVLYLLAGPISNGRLHDLDASQLRDALVKAGLGTNHRQLKLFASGSGDALGGPSYAEQVYDAMRGEFPQIEVFGYLGQVDTDGFDGHKTAGLLETEALEGLSRDQWLARGARAKENRVHFPPKILA